MRRKWWRGFKLVRTRTKTTDETQIRVVIEQWADALRNKNATDVFSHYAPKLVHFSLAPPLLSATSDAMGLSAWFATWDGPIGYEIHDLTTTVGGNVAFSHSLNRMHGTKTDGSKGDLWFRHTLGFRKIGSELKIAHEHESGPSIWMAASKLLWTSSRSQGTTASRPSRKLSSPIAWIVQKGSPLRTR
jgi:ketosteroid isomerase-like protein